MRAISSANDDVFVRPDLIPVQGSFTKTAYLGWFWSVNMYGENYVSWEGPIQNDGNSWSAYAHSDGSWRARYSPKDMMMGSPEMATTEGRASGLSEAILQVLEHMKSQGVSRGLKKNFDEILQRATTAKVAETYPGQAADELAGSGETGLLMGPVDTAWVEDRGDFYNLRTFVRGGPNNTSHTITQNEEGQWGWRVVNYNGDELGSTNNVGTLPDAKRRADEFDRSVTSSVREGSVTKERTTSMRLTATDFGFLKSAADTFDTDCEWGSCEADYDDPIYGFEQNDDNVYFAHEVCMAAAAEAGEGKVGRKVSEEEYDNLGQ